MDTPGTPHPLRGGDIPPLLEIQIENPAKFPIRNMDKYIHKIVLKWGKGGGLYHGRRVTYLGAGFSRWGMVGHPPSRGYPPWRPVPPFHKLLSPPPHPHGNIDPLRVHIFIISYKDILTI